MRTKLGRRLEYHTCFMRAIIGEYEDSEAEDALLEGLGLCDDDEDIFPNL